MRSSLRFVAMVAMLMALIVVGAACGIPTDGEPQAIELPTPTPETPATATPSQSVPTTIYLTDEDSQVREAVRDMAQPVTTRALVLELLEVPTEEETELGLVSRIPPETMLASDPQVDENLDGSLTALVDFLPGGIDTLEGEDLTLALAQLVWTLTEPPQPITQVIISIDGVQEQWPTDSEDKLVLTREDYASFHPDFVEPTPSPEDPPVEEDADGGS
ncbi:MAG: GerMN domain-containing protein [Acidimicrobiales bacterium]